MLKSVIRRTRESFTRHALCSKKSKDVWRIIHRILKPTQQPLRIDPDKLNNFFASTALRTLAGLQQLIDGLTEEDRPMFSLKEFTRTYVQD